MKEGLKLKIIYFEDMDYSAVYVHPSNLKGLISSHRNRPICKIVFDGKFILRKLRAKSIDGLDANTVIIDYVSSIELGVKEGSLISLKKANFLQRWVTYYRKNPNEDLRAAWWYFVIGQLIAVASLIIGIISILK